MKIGNIDFGDKPVFLAPMEDVTDHSFRLICREQGADMVYTEFVSAEALIRNIASTTRKLHIDDRERPAAIQIYGRDTEAMVQAAKIVEAAKPDIFVFLQSFHTYIKILHTIYIREPARLCKIHSKLF